MIDIKKYLDNFNRGTKDNSLKAMKFFLKKYNNFVKNMKFIHIAGTNGKGSCTEIISNILINQGYKVGKFSSPHLIKYNERISIDNKEITNLQMENIIIELQPLIEEYNEKEEKKVTFFELITIMALLYFYRNNVDFVVLEVGLGGLYDCTNIVINVVASVITSIGYDHMSILGDTLEKIAYQKAGIIKKGSYCIINSTKKSIDDIFINECEKKNNKLYIINSNDIKNYKYSNKYQYFDYKELKNLCTNLKGKVQISNICLCLEVMSILKKLGYKVSIKNIRKGLKNVIHKGRFEELSKKPLIIFDGAHNEPAIKNLQQNIKMYYKNRKRLYIISILKSKDYDKMLKLMAEDKNSTFILTSGIDKKSFVKSDDLYICMKKYISCKNLYKMKLDKAILYVLNSNRNVVNFIIGSFYTYEAVKNVIK